MGELAPTEFGEEFSGPGLGSADAGGSGGAQHRVPDLARPQLAVMQVRRKPRSGGQCGAIALIGIGVQVCLDKLPQLPRRAGEARRLESQHLALRSKEGLDLGQRGAAAGADHQFRGRVINDSRIGPGVEQVPGDRPAIECLAARTA